MVLPRTPADQLPHQLRHTSEAVRVSRPHIKVALVERDAETGLVVQKVVVDDTSESSVAAPARRAVLEVLDDMLRAHPEWPAPVVGDAGIVTTGNPVSEWLYRSGPLSEWRRELVPSAMALYPVQRQDQPLPSGSSHDETTRLVLGDSLDAMGIRTRARIMSDVVGRTLRASAAGAPDTWVSLACGAAVPVLDARAEHASAAKLVLVDLDTSALAFASQLAAAAGLEQGRDFVTLHRDLVRSVVARDSLVHELGPETAGVVDALGIFEYFNDASAIRLLRNAFRLVRPAGALVVGNMLADRPQLAFNQRGAGWPKLYVRSVDDLVELVRRAGLPLDATTISIPQDGVYAVVDVVKPLR